MNPNERNEISMPIAHRLTIDSLTVSEIFHGQSRFTVPSYQRGYAWGDEQVKQLLDDVQEGLKDEPEKSYILGQIITCINTETNSIDIVDGQQRMTTLFILLAKLWHSVRSHVAFDSISMLDRARFDAVTALLVAGGADNHLVPKLHAAKDGADYVKHILNNLKFPGSEESLTQQNIREAAETIQAFIEQELDELEKLLAFLFFVLENVTVFRLPLESPKQALHVFAKMNNRGLTLDDADLLKNLLFIMVNDDEHFSTLSGQWDKASRELFKSRLKRVKSMEFLMKALIGIKLGDSVPTSKVFEKWEGELKTANDALEFAAKLPGRAKNLAEITHGRTPQHGSDCKETIGSQMFNWVQHLELLLAGDGLVETSYIELAKVVETRVILSLFAQEKNQKFEAMLHKWGKKISALPPQATREEIIATASDAFANVDELLEAAKVGLGNLDYEVGSHRPKIRYVLARCAYMVQVATNEINHSTTLGEYLVTPSRANPAGFAIDHVFPQSAAKRQFWQGEREEKIHRLGNLVLLHSSDNQSQSDDLPWEESKRISYANSRLNINKFLPNGADGQGLQPRVTSFIEQNDANMFPALAEWSSENATDRRFELYWKIFENSIRSVIKI